MQEEERESHFSFLENKSEKNIQTVLVGSRARLNQTQNWSCFISKVGEIMSSNVDFEIKSCSS